MTFSTLKDWQGQPGLQEGDRLVRACHHGASIADIRILDVRPLISEEVVAVKRDFRKRMWKHLG